ncbi:hypothetical protein A2115_02085 [Candidatus Woesebacteria bacterium GWA1_41_8]|uniref:Uncharacterized protein n=1 Tax=Candidatus Woesebacteria bacterium GWA1_41_8 TaxID=1802471 RepID=A0A1F7WH30_9BACT|nr:MAG: hypothetical protein A2115_02085 [Candidatus Woesebacteria bacterium GWA1_41_8]
MRDEILAGIKNAMDRGSSLDDAVRSFINAGYNPVEVKDAASQIQDGATTILNPQTPKKLPSSNNLIPPKSQDFEAPLQSSYAPKKSRKWIIVLILILLLLAIGIVLITIFQKQILGLLA